MLSVVCLFINLSVTRSVYNKVKVQFRGVRSGRNCFLNQPDMVNFVTTRLIQQRQSVHLIAGNRPDNRQDHRPFIESN